MKWNEVKVEIESEVVEVVVNILMEVGVSGVVIEDFLDVEYF